MAKPPPLPPRGEPDDPEIVTPSEFAVHNVGRHRTHTNHLTPLHALAQITQKRSISPDGLSVLNDPRSSSTQSLGDGDSHGDGRRTLLIIYIHGFVGDETSFQSFPAHVHNVLVKSLKSTHIIYSKVYPRYKTRRDMSIARDDFSKWLIPHESDQTDVILVGHSLGGILATEIVLMQNSSPDDKEYFKHKILGLVAFDTPFLGMHPGIVKSGLASVFRPTSNENKTTTPVQSPCSEVATPLSISPSMASTANMPIADQLSPISNDPNFNPSYPNDVKLRTHTGNLERAMYFWNKHCGELFKASQSYFQSYIDFGGCLADFVGLRRRYDAIRSLEEVESPEPQKVRNGQSIHRVRFVNYYTASSGRIRHSPRHSPAPNLDDERRLSTDQTSMRSLSPRPVSESLESRTSTELSRDEKHEAGDLHTSAAVTVASIQCHDVDKRLDAQSQSPLLPDEISRAFPDETSGTSNDTQILEKPMDEDLPAIPPQPATPPPLDESKWQSKDALKLAQQERRRQLKAYEQAKKDRNKAINAREKVLAKRLKLSQKQAAKVAKAEVQKENNAENQASKRQVTLNPKTYDAAMEREAEKRNESTTPNKQRDLKFCLLPRKDPKTGSRDPTWVRVYMEGMDEVEAHQHMFTIRETYGQLVADVAARIESWVHDEADPRNAGMPVAEPVD